MREMISMVASGDRVVIHLDVDCFYAQAEILRRPSLRDRPVGITQKFLVVTCNYVARQLGVPKMVSIEEAKRRCPDLVLINGEDLTPYRAASKSIMKVFQRFGTLERRGLDECAVDITAEVNRRAEAGTSVESFSGFVLGYDEEQKTIFPCENSHRNFLLMLGTQLAAEMRRAVEQETGFQCSCGIAHNKMLAKMACSLNKPNKQTCILQSAVPNYLFPLPVRKLPGVGTQTGEALKGMGIKSVGDLQTLTFQQLSCKFGDRVGKLLFEACRGHDDTPVQEKGYPKSLSVEDSFKPCTSLEQAKEILQSLAPDLIARLDEDKEETGRRPKAFTVKWRSQGVWKFTTISTQMPTELLLSSIAMERRKEVLVETGMKLLLQSLQGRAFCVLNIGATNFIDSMKSPSPSADIRSFMRSPSKSLSKTESANVLSKREARLQREAVQGNRAGYTSRFELAKADTSSEPFLQGSPLGSCSSEEDDEGEHGEKMTTVTSSRSCNLDAFSGAGLRGEFAGCVKRSDSARSEWGDLEEEDIRVKKDHTDIGATSVSFEAHSDVSFRTCTRTAEEVQKHRSKGSTACEKCGETYGNDDLKQQHMDYHLALELHLQENAYLLADTKARTKRARRNGTLDSFVVKL